MEDFDGTIIGTNQGHVLRLQDREGSKLVGKLQSRCFEQFTLLNEDRGGLVEKRGDRELLAGYRVEGSFEDIERNLRIRVTFEVC